MLTMLETIANLQTILGPQLLPNSLAEHLMNHFNASLDRESERALGD